jgi:hypothetical protein
MNSVENLIKIILAVLLFLCLADMPYGYYEFVRFASMIGFGILGYKAYSRNNQTMMVVYGSLALLFQPFFKVALGRDLWNIVDVVVGVWLLGNTLIKKETKV